jgi:hypothetical protein
MQENKSLTVYNVDFTKDRQEMQARRQAEEEAKLKAIEENKKRIFEKALKKEEEIKIIEIEKVFF